MKHFIKASAWIILLTVLAACGGRESDLRNIWAQTVKTDTIDAYLSFLSQQKPDEDREAGTVTFYNSGEHSRRDVARTRILEIARKTAHGSCPFKTLYVDLRQNIQGVESHFDLERSGMGEMLRQLGVEFSKDQSRADESLILVLNGVGWSSDYFPQGGGRIVSVTAGGSVEGEMWLSALPEHKVSFKGQFEALSVVTPIEAQYNGRIFPAGLHIAMDKAGLMNTLAHVLYDSCGSAAAAYVYFSREVAGWVSSRTEDPELEKRLAGDFEKARPVVIAASLGSAAMAINGFSYVPSLKALKFLNRESGNEWPLISSAWHNTNPDWEHPDWFKEPPAVAAAQNPR